MHDSADAMANRPNAAIMTLIMALNATNYVNHGSNLHGLQDAMPTGMGHDTRDQQ